MIPLLVLATIPVPDGIGTALLRTQYPLTASSNESGDPMLLILVPFASMPPAFVQSISKILGVTYSNADADPFTRKYFPAFPENDEGAPDRSLNDNVENIYEFAAGFTRTILLDCPEYDVGVSVKLVKAKPLPLPEVIAEIR